MLHTVNSPHSKPAIFTFFHLQFAKTNTVSHCTATEYKTDNEPAQRCSIVKLRLSIKAVKIFSLALQTKSGKFLILQGCSNQFNTQITTLFLHLLKGIVVNK